MTTPEPASWRLRLARRLTGTLIGDLEHDVRRVTIERDVAQADLVAARRTVEVVEQHANRDPDRHAHTTLGAVLARATRSGDQATIRVPIAVLDEWLQRHHLTSEGRAEQLATVPMADVEPGPGDRSVLPLNPTYAGSTIGPVA